MTVLIIVLLAVALLVGATAGFVIAARQLPHTLSRMSDDQLNTLADEVRELKHGPG